MDASAIFLIVFSVLVLILAIANSIYFWKSYSTPEVGYSKSYALALLVANVIIAIVALLGLIYAVYMMVYKPKVKEEVIKYSTNVPLSPSRRRQPNAEIVFD